MGIAQVLSGSTPVPNLLITALAIATLVLLWWTVSLVTDRNPLPFPDRDYHVFSATSPAGLVALEDLMRRHGHAPRFRVDTEQVERTIFGNGTIVNYPYPSLTQRLGHPGGALGFVVRDPNEAAKQAAQLLRRHGFEASIIEGAEPGLPITFVTTDALSSAVLVFRKHVLRMGRKPPAWTERRLLETPGRL